MLLECCWHCNYLHCNVNHDSSNQSSTVMHLDRPLHLRRLRRRCSDDIRRGVCRLQQHPQEVGASICDRWVVDVVAVMPSCSSFFTVACQHRHHFYHHDHHHCHSRGKHRKHGWNQVDWVSTFGQCRWRQAVQVWEVSQRRYCVIVSGCDHCHCQLRHYRVVVVGSRCYHVKSYLCHCSWLLVLVASGFHCCYSCW